MSYSNNGVRPGHGVKPESWTTHAITSVATVQGSVSWWLETKTRDEFNAKQKAEQSRMSVSKFGSVTRLVGD